MSCHVISSHIMPCHLISCHVISYHPISAHLSSHLISFRCALLRAAVRPPAAVFGAAFGAGLLCAGLLVTLKVALAWALDQIGPLLLHMHLFAPRLRHNWRYLKGALFSQHLNQNRHKLRSWRNFLSGWTSTLQLQAEIYMVMEQQLPLARFTHAPYIHTHMYIPCLTFTIQGDSVS